MKRYAVVPILAAVLLIAAATPAAADTKYAEHCDTLSPGAKTAKACAALWEYLYFGATIDYAIVNLSAWGEHVYRLDIDWVKLWSRSSLSTSNYCSGDTSSCTGEGNEMDDFTGPAWSESLTEQTARWINTRCYVHAEMRWRVQWNQGGNWSSYQITNSYEHYRC